MSDKDDFTRLDDPAFLAERRRVREKLEQKPQNQAKAELMDRFHRLNEEFLRRARMAWTQVSQEGNERCATRRGQSPR